MYIYGNTYDSVAFVFYSVIIQKMKNKMVKRLDIGDVKCRLICRFSFLYYLLVYVYGRRVPGR